jgi:hypothetical protein
MIRPITVICWILALGAGLYLYRAKHEVELMDKQIEQIARATNEIRAESRHLLDDWIRLGEPEQLHKYSDEYLGLKTIAPTQFARLSDLVSRLPAPRVDPPPETVEAAAQPAAQPVAARSTDAETDSADEADADSLPVPPIPPPVNAVVLQAVTTVPLQARPVTPRVAAEQRPRPIETHAAEEPRQLPPKPTPMTAMEPHPSGPVQPSAPPTPQVRAHELPPLQAQDQPRGRDVPWQSQGQGLPPLQARGLQPAPMQPPSLQHAPMQPASLQAVPSQPAPNRPPEARVASDPRREIPPASLRPVDARGLEPQLPRQVAAPGPPAGSLLGSARGVVPLPLPAPTPVSAAWPGAGR